MNPPNWENINPNQFDYSLPQQRIAQFPLKDRDDSKLLFYDRGEIKHHVFKELIDLIPSNSLLFFNNTKVIPARIFFEKPTGARIEIFLLQPAGSSQIIEEVMKTTRKCTWFCIIGNLKKWKADQPLTRNLNIGTKQETLYAKLLDKKKHLVEFTWDDPEIQFGAIVGTIGKIPLPPYIERETVSLDKERYQTVYARYEGAVAAPTAGLHFTQPQLEELAKKGIQIDYLTLHVSGATFQPIKPANLKDHPMHAEHIIISNNN
ncbi:MAG: S-adenosylmethionine:tRNA ribosyltransferase-isomerase, partial [Bacteroidetes bacterium]|nr:S-adenosylmethionine:tRNA ribosyltransferase-isomerase [Bacteroidota bacterium]